MAFEFVMGYRLLQDARQRKIGLSAMLEQLDPTTDYPEHERGLDAFERQLMRYDIRTVGDPENGLLPHKWERFFEDDELGTREERASLAAEWLNRQYRKYRNGGFAAALQTGGVRFPADAPVSYTLYPPATLNELRFKQLQPSVLPVLLARTRVIDSETFTALYLSDSAASAAARMSRIEEYAEVPTASFTESEQSIRVKKYGRALRTSYEQLRRMRLDLVSWAIGYIAAKADRDKEDTAVDVIVNGDGNSSTAATNTNGSTLDGAAAGQLTLKMWLAYRMKKWVRPYRNDVIIAPSDALVTLFLLNAGSANVAPIVYLGSNANMPDALNVRMARTTLEGVVAVDNDTAPANKLVGIDSSVTLEMVLEANSEIVETERVISNQYEAIVMTENVGFAIATKDQNQALAYTA